MNQGELQDALERLRASLPMERRRREAEEAAKRAEAVARQAARQAAKEAVFRRVVRLGEDFAREARAAGLPWAEMTVGGLAESLWCIRKHRPIEFVQEYFRDPLSNEGSHSTRLVPGSGQTGVGVRRVGRFGQVVVMIEPHELEPLTFANATRVDADDVVRRMAEMLVTHRDHHG